MQFDSDAEGVAYYLAKYTKPQSPSGCVEWSGPTNGSGRPCMWLPGHRRIYAYRAAWIASRGAIPDGLEVCHVCDNPGCLNVEHLFLGTHRENMKDAISKGRMVYVVPRRGEDSHKAKHPHEVVEEAIRRCKAGEPIRKVAREMGVSRDCVRRWFKHGMRQFRNTDEALGAIRTRKSIPDHICEVAS